MSTTLTFFTVAKRQGLFGLEPDSVQKTSEAIDGVPISAEIINLSDPGVIRDLPDYLKRVVEHMSGISQAQLVTVRKIGEPETPSGDHLHQFLTSVGFPVQTYGMTV